MRLSSDVHDRGAAGMNYVYPVVSRRARGVSVGVNLNPNNACNWRCVYCQVPGLVAGRAPEIHLSQLEDELVRMLDALVNGDYMQRHVPPQARRLSDVAFSGNGEPTSSRQFGAAIELVVSVVARFGLSDDVRIVVISNGSLFHRTDTRAALERLAAASGEVWFKLDSATEQGRRRMGAAATSLERARRNLRTCAALCRTWIQTMCLERQGQPPSEREREAYLAFLRDALEQGVCLAGVHLYGLARKSYQPEAHELGALPRAWMEAWAERIRALGLTVQLSP